MLSATGIKLMQKQPSAIRDLQRDWDGWGPWERRAVGALAITSFACSIFWLAMSLGLML
ncbi:hypothetical protein GCM10008941_30450 [Rhizomicrobium palustre]